MNQANQSIDNNNNSNSAPAPMVMNLPSSLGAIDEDDISLPLSLIKGLRRKHHHGMDPSTASANAMDSSTSSNTSDKDDSGGDDSNTSSTSKPLNDMAGTLSVGQISSLSGSEQEGNNRGRAGILRVGGGNNNAGFSSSSDENITGDDELSEKVVVHGKSVTSSQQQEQQVQYKVSFAEGHCAKNGDEAIASKRKRNQEKKSASVPRAEEKKIAKRQRMVNPEEFKNSAISFPVSDSSSGNEVRMNLMNGQNDVQQEQLHGGAARAVSSSSSTSKCGGQDPGQASCSSPLYSQTEGPSEQETDKNGPSKSDLTKVHVAKPSSPSKEQLFQDSEERRRERNQREKERSNKIASQVDTLRCLLQRGGLFIPKKTKSSVLSEASNYIKTLQDRQQMMNMEMENLKCQLVTAVAARGQQAQAQKTQGQVGEGGQDYHLIFKNTMAGMCVASMGGALLDCNAAFEKETGLSQAKMNEMTIFNMIHANDLQRALDLISRMIDTGYVVGQGGNNNQAAAQGPQGQDQQEQLLLKSSFQNRPDLGLCVTLVRGTDSLPKCFSVTLVKNANGNSTTLFDPALPAIPSMPIESKPIMAGVMSQLATSQQPGAVSLPPVNTVNTMAPTGTGIMANNMVPIAPGANLAQGPAVGGPAPAVGTAPTPQAAAPQAPMQVSQPATAGLPIPQPIAPGVPPTPQLLQLLLLQQMQQGQGQQPLQPMNVSQQQQIQPQPQLQQYQQYQQQLPQMNQGPTQLPVNVMIQNPSPAAGPAIPGYWNPQNIAMLPQIQQILQPPAGTNSSPQGSGDESTSQGLNQNQPAVPPAAAMPGYLNGQNIPMIPQIQQMLNPADSNASSQGSKASNNDEKDDSRPWYYAG